MQKWEACSIMKRNVIHLYHVSCIARFIRTQLTVYFFICFGPPCTMENRTICKFLINCHSAEYFLINFNCSSTGNDPISLKSKQKQRASRRLRGGKKHSKMCLTGYISVLQLLFVCLFFFVWPDSQKIQQSLITGIINKPN